MGKKLNRRTFIRGSGSAFLSLPVLEIMLNSHGELFAQTNSMMSKRFVSMFAGISLSGTSSQGFYPTATGANYNLTIGLQPLGNHGVKSDVTVLSNLRMAAAGFHGKTQMLQIAGVEGTTYPSSDRGPTADQIIANEIGLKNNGSYDRGLILSVQPRQYRGDTPFSSSFDMNRTKVQAEVSPRALYQRLFGNFVPKEDPNAKRRHEMRLSVLDLVKSEYSKFMKTLGKADQQRMSDHADFIRDVERKIAQVPPTDNGGLCQKPNDPGADPRSSNQNDGQGSTIGYSGEDIRADVMIDLIHLAFVCDMHRTAAVNLTLDQTFMNCRTLSPIQDFNLDMHELGHRHSSNSDYLAYAHRWHVDKYAKLIKKLKDSPEGSGNILDNTVLVYYAEGGHGAGGPHTCDNMASLIAGGNKLGIKTGGQHIRTNKEHPAKVFGSAMRAFGITPKVGPVTGDISQIF